MAPLCLRAIQKLCEKLLDTVTILLPVHEPDWLSPLSVSLIEDELKELYLSAISVWEISAKCSIGKLKLATNVSDFITEMVARYRLHVSEFSIADGFFESSLPLIHRDPFDRMLICQALSRDLAILTPDHAIRQYPATTIW